MNEAKYIPCTLTKCSPADHAYSGVFFTSSGHLNAVQLNQQNILLWTVYRTYSSSNTERVVVLLPERVLHESFRVGTEEL